MDQALTGHAIKSRSSEGTELWTPEEYEDVDSQLRPKGEAPWRERIAQTMSESTPVPKILHDWSMSHGGFLVGDLYDVARNLRDLTTEMNTAGKVNETTLYRGAKRSPALDAEGSIPLSYTEDPYVGRTFAKYNEGPVWKAPAGSVRGLRLPDYVERQRTVGSGRRPEREWLVDPDTIIGR